MPGIGSFIREIAVQISDMLESKPILLSKTNAKVLSVKKQALLVRCACTGEIATYVLELKRSHIDLWLSRANCFSDYMEIAWCMAIRWWDDCESKGGLLNAFHAAGECRRQVKNLTNFVKNFKIVEFHNHIRNHHEQCIQISTNMPSPH